MFRCISNVGVCFFEHPSYLELHLAVFRAVDHQWSGDLFATAGAQVDIWNHNRFSSHLISLLRQSAQAV